MKPYDDIIKNMREEKICVIVPTYNNAGTIIEILERILLYSSDVIVIDDGSTDNTETLLKSAMLPIMLISHQYNQGKGIALRDGLIEAKEYGYRYAITIDSDGQHYPEDIPLFLDAITKNPDTLIVGNRNLKNENLSSGSSFANKFSNFWFMIQTGLNLPDTQTGYRLYPLSMMRGLNYITSRYEAELELLVFSAWHGIKLQPLDIRVYYPPSGERVSHFRPVTDFVRISILNIVLCFLAVVYGLPMRIIRRLIG
ncbi:glycosyltransferase family 2 protein [Xylanibacter oryzae]|uniref:glycosyltransferase family 2 protein n=1 Tax=Xylanibacter oryzae TaxID=185293 RepID=UPI0004BB27BC|nr:glycosyltransferase family 2 protein [Xylanibacter oryzae]